MDKCSNKLDNLEHRQIFFPPDELFESRTHGRYQIVGIHHGVNQRVEDDESEKNTVTTTNVAHAGPEEDGHHTVVIEVKPRDLPLFLPQHQKECVEKSIKFDIKCVRMAVGLLSE